MEYLKDFSEFGKIADNENNTMNEAVDIGVILGLVVTLVFALGPSICMVGVDAIERMRRKIRFKPFVKGVMKLMVKYNDRIMGSDECPNLKALLGTPKLDFFSLKDATRNIYREECRRIMDDEDYHRFCELTDGIVKEMAKHTEEFDIRTNSPIIDTFTSDDDDEDEGAYVF